MVALLAVWTNWSIYPPVFTNGLEATFLQTGTHFFNVCVWAQITLY